MIIRRRHTANFTTIGNALFEDERLAADEVGVLAFLLSRPNDWEVRRPQLAKRFDVGRDSIKRIIFNCMLYGWIIGRKIRLSNGSYHTIYEVRDEPGPELTPEQVRNALSVVSTEAVDPEESEGTDTAPDYGGGGPPETGPPPTPQPGVASQLRQTRRGSSKEELLNTNSINPESPICARVFADVKALWPYDHILSSVRAESAFVGLTDAKKEPCYQGIKPYLADCRASNRLVCDLTTYIREERWERFQASGLSGQDSGKRYEIKPGTPQWYRWSQYYEVTNPNAFALMKTWAGQGRSRWETSEWPPALSTQSQATGPPSPAQSDSDEFEIV
jgi:predicted transcriptional regulator